MRSGTHEVIAPNMIRSFRPQPHTGTVIQPQSSPGSLLLRHFQPLPPPDSLHSVLAHFPARTPQQRRDPSVPVSARTAVNARATNRSRECLAIFGSRATGFGSQEVIELLSLAMLPQGIPEQACRSDNGLVLHCPTACSSGWRQRGTAQGCRSFEPRHIPQHGYCESSPCESSATNA